MSINKNISLLCICDDIVAKTYALENSDTWDLLDLNSIFNDFYDFKKYSYCLFLVTENVLLLKQNDIIEWCSVHHHLFPRLIVFTDKHRSLLKIQDNLANIIQLYLPSQISKDVFISILLQTYNIIRLQNENINLNLKLEAKTSLLKRVIDIGRLLGEERDLDKLLYIMLLEIRDILGADSGSILVVERTKDNTPPTHLRFKSTILDIGVEDQERLLPINKKSIAGYVTLTGKILKIDDVYKLTGEEEYTFNSAYDKRFNYRTMSNMTIPLKDHRDNVIGVIQLINRKKSPHKVLFANAINEHTVIPFDETDVFIAEAFAGQASVSLQNTFLIQDIHNLFEGFVQASVTAIEQRDPTTSGHSFRVAEYTVGLLKAVDAVRDGVFKNVVFSKEQIREVRYASLLHDFGKVGVREHVLQKAKKLYDHELEYIRLRSQLFKKTVTESYFKRRALLFEKNKSPDLAVLDFLEKKKNQKLLRIDEMFNVILKANEPSLLTSEISDTLEYMTNLHIELEGEHIPFLKKNELMNLSIRKGSLNEQERKEIESHVSHTYTFLKQIPWTTDLCNIPDIAHGHHEKLDGTGYPLSLTSEKIVLQARMMAIADIYDALTASDRPYKTAVSPEKALSILDFEVKDGHIDANLLEIFKKAKIYSIIDNSKKNS